MPPTSDPAARLMTIVHVVPVDVVPVDAVPVDAAHSASRSGSASASS